jgi:hypothetical protein
MAYLMGMRTMLVNFRQIGEGRGELLQLRLVVLCFQKQMAQQQLP